MNWLMVIVGAAVGAPLRYLIDRAVQSRHDTGLPWGTFAANLTACAVLGLLAGAVMGDAVPVALQHLVGTGLCATLSTYSTFSLETLRLAQTGAKLLAAANVVISVVAGFAAAEFGVVLANALVSG